MRAAKIMGGRLESSVTRPQRRSEDQRDRGQQVHVDEANPLAVKTVAPDERQRFVVIRDRGGRKVLKQFQNFLAVGQVSAGNFTDDQRMHDDNAALEKIDQLRIAAAQVVDPHRCVNQDQDPVSERLRGETFRLGCVPPRRASRLALSRSISAFKPSRTIADRSKGPASRVALASKSSSIVIVVRTINAPDAGIKYSII